MTSTKAIQQYTVNCAAFAKELGFISRAREGKGTMPILSTVKLEPRDGYLHMTVTSLDTTAQSKIELIDAPLISSDPVAVCVDHRRLLSIVKGLSEAEARLTIESDSLMIQSGKRSKFNLSGWKASDFPDVENVEGLSVQLPSIAIAGMLAATQYSVSVEEDAKHMIHALELSVRSTGLQMTGTNGKICARAEVEVSLNAEFKVGLNRFLLGALADLSASSETIVCTLSERAVKFHDGSVEKPGIRSLSGRLLAGKPPAYDTIFDANAKPVCTFSRTEAYNAIGRVLNVSDDTEKGLKPINLSLTDGQIEITASARDVGDGNDGFAVENGLSGYKARYNGWQLCQALNACQAETVHMGDAGNACRFDAWWLLDATTKLKYTTLSAQLKTQAAKE